MATRERENDQSERMSEHEALMWNIEKDPWLNPSGSSVMILDKPIDMEQFHRQMRNGIAKTPRLYQRAVPGFGRLSTPAWVPDIEFNLDAHLREVILPVPGNDRQLLDLCARLYSEPLDRTRPLWRFVIINGLSEGRSALWAIIHHSVSDGIGQLRMAELYQQTTRDEEAPPDINLEAIIAEAAAQHDAKESGGNLATSLISTVRNSASHAVRRQVGIGRRLLGEVAMWPADPSRIGKTAGTAVDTIRSISAQLTPSSDVEHSGSPLWVERSRGRHLEWVRLDVDDLKRTGKTLGATMNDVFLAGLAEATHRYHARHGSTIETTNSSFVLSTRTDGKVGGNAFTPVPVRLPAGNMKPQERLATVSAMLAEAKEEAQRTGGMIGVSGIANLLPISVVTRAARSAASRIDFATSNLRGAPFELYVSGAKVLATVAMGPVAGTGANITAMSYDGAFDIGIFCDPAAITDPAGFRDDIIESFADLVALA